MIGWPAFFYKGVDGGGGRSPGSSAGLRYGRGRSGRRLHAPPRPLFGHLKNTPKSRRVTGDQERESDVDNPRDRAALRPGDRDGGRLRQPVRSGGAAGGSPGGSAKGGTGPRLLFITNSNSDWWNAVEKGMLDGGAEFGAQVELRRNEGQPEGQIRLLEDALSLPDVQGVAVSVLEAESPGIADKMRDLQKAGKIVIAIDSDGQADARRAYIGTNNRKAGEAAGKAAATLGPRGARRPSSSATPPPPTPSSAARASSQARARLQAGRGLRGRRRQEPGAGRTSRPRSPSTPTSASCSASGRTTPPGSPRRSASRPSSASG